MHNCVDIMNLGKPDIKTERINNYIQTNEILIINRSQYMDMFHKN